MSPESQRIAIAEACGYKNCRIVGGVYGKDRISFLKSYATDANAMLPLLKQYHAYDWTADPDEKERLNGGVCVALVNGPAAYARTFARAACIALLCAHRAARASQK